MQNIVVVVYGLCAYTDKKKYTELIRRNGSLGVIIIYAEIITHPLCSINRKHTVDCNLSVDLLYITLLSILHVLMIYLTKINLFAVYTDANMFTH